MCLFPGLNNSTSGTNQLRQRIGMPLFPAFNSTPHDWKKQQEANTPKPPSMLSGNRGVDSNSLILGKNRTLGG